MNSMLFLYMTPIPSTEGNEMMKSEKEKVKTWPGTTSTFLTWQNGQVTLRKLCSNVCAGRH